MADFVTVLTFTYPAELMAVRGRLEVEGIECNIKEEYIVQADNFLSNAVGGIKLQVRYRDVDRAVAVLKETGYIKEEDAGVSELEKMFDEYTSKLPLIHTLSIELRFIIVGTVVILVFIAVFLFIISHQ